MLSTDPIPVPLRDRAGTIVAFAVIDAANIALTLFRWHLDSDPRGGGKMYARRAERSEGRRVQIYLHRQVIGPAPSEGLVVDHINGLTLDNRLENLRFLTVAENAQNIRRRHTGPKHSRYRGVTWNKAKRKWQAFATLGGRYKNIGYFDSEDDAGAAASAWRAEHMPFSQDARASA